METDINYRRSEDVVDRLRRNFALPDTGQFSAAGSSPFVDKHGKYGRFIMRHYVGL